VIAWWEPIEVLLHRRHRPHEDASTTTDVKQFKRIGASYRNADNNHARILLANAVRTAACTPTQRVVHQEWEEPS